MKPNGLNTKIFLDSGNPEETKRAISALGFLDGQTTNPSLVARHPDVKRCLEEGRGCTREDIYGFYKDIVQEISKLIPDGSVSIEVYADHKTTSDQMLIEGREMFTWISNAHIKFPTTHEGLKAAHKAIEEGMRVNMTLCFTQDQAAAVYAATSGAKKGDVFVSPFVGRLDDRGENGMDLIKNIIKMYRGGDGHVEVLTASVRTLDHFLYALYLESDIITAPLKVLQEWSDVQIKLPGADFKHSARDLSEIPYRDLDLSADWQSFDLADPLVAKGLEGFAADWNKLIKHRDS